MPSQPACGGHTTVVELFCAIAAHTETLGTTSRTWCFFSTTEFTIQPTGLATVSPSPIDVSAACPYNLDVPFTFAYWIPYFSISGSNPVSGSCLGFTGLPYAVTYATTYSNTVTTSVAPDFLMVENAFLDLQGWPVTVAPTAYGIESQTFEGSIGAYATDSARSPTTEATALPLPPVPAPPTPAEATLPPPTSGLEPSIGVFSTTPTTILQSSSTSEFHESSPPTASNSSPIKSSAPIPTGSLNPSLSPGTKIGIGVGASLGTVIIILLALLLWRQERGRRHKTKNVKETVKETVTRRWHAMPFVFGMFGKNELDAEGQRRNELEATTINRELEAELVYELPVEEAPGELRAEKRALEVEGDIKRDVARRPTTEAQGEAEP